ncbi:MAG: hypothetical protein ABSE73_02770 [Planctomycetota bacterium]
MRGWFWVPVLLVSNLAGQAREYAPRVLSPHNADAYSMKTFAEYARWKDLQGDAKVFEIFKYLTDKRTGIFPMGAGAWEGKDVLYDFGFIRDPVKMINVYTCGYCDMLGPTMAGIMQDMGIGQSRTVNIPGWGHVASEVFYGGKWHYLDLDVRAVFRREDGSLASLAEAQKDDSLWNRPNSAIFFPGDDLPNTRKVYAQSPVEYRYGVNMGGHTMDYALRSGETFTRWWKSQGGRWNHHASYNARPFPRNLVEKEPRGPKCKHPSFTVWPGYGNGRFVYKPNLTAESTDFEDGAYDSRNVTPGAEGLTLKEPGEGCVIFEVRSPYVIVPLVGNLDTTADDKGASVVRLAGEGLAPALAVSLDNGLTWKDTAATDGLLDLTPQVARTYGYLLRITLKGEPGKAVLKSLEITTWVQLHPAALPSLRQGKNELRYVTGDHYGLQSRVVEIRTNGSDREDFLKYCCEPPKDFDPNRKTARAQGPFVVKLQAPPGAKIAWFSGGGNFTAHQGAAAPNTRNSMACAVEESKDVFKDFYKAEIPAGQNHWHYNADVEVRLERPTKTVFVRYTGDPGVNNLRLYAHCVDDHPSASRPVAITHAWTENGVPKTKQVILEKPGAYEVVAEAEPTDEYLEIAVPSGVKP